MTLNWLKFYNKTLSTLKEYGETELTMINPYIGHIYNNIDLLYKNSKRIFKNKIKIIINPDNKNEMMLLNPQRIINDEGVVLELALYGYKEFDEIHATGIMLNDLSDEVMTVGFYKDTKEIFTALSEENVIQFNKSSYFGHFKFIKSRNWKRISNERLRSLAGILINACK